MKLALYLPNFRDEVTVKELEDLTARAEDLDFDSVWTLDRIIVPEASDRAELQFPFGMMTDFPPQMPVIARGKWFQGMTLIPWLAAKTTKVRIGMSIIDTPVPLAGRARRRARHPGPPLQRPAQRRRRVGLDARGVRRGQRSAPVPAPARPRARDDRDHAGHLGRTSCSSTTASSPTSSSAASATSRCRSPARRSTSPASRTRTARPSASRSTACRAGSASRTRPRTSSAGRARWSASWTSSAAASPTASTCAA